MSEASRGDSPGNRLRDALAKQRSRAEGKAEEIRERIRESRRRFADMSPEERKTYLKEAPDRIKENIVARGTIGVLTSAPLITILICLAVTAFLTYQSGAVTQWFGVGNATLNVTGDLEAYLPEGEGDAGNVRKELEAVEADWTSNVMIVYIESNQNNITNEIILREISMAEDNLNPYRDNADDDDAIYVLSIASIIKEINSSGPRVTKALLTESTQGQGLAESIAQAISEQIDEQEDLLGSYRIPPQERINQIIDTMPPNALDYLVQDTEPRLETDGQWDRAVIIVGVAENRPASLIIEETESLLANLSAERGWEDLGLKMSLTGPVPITNAVTNSIVSSFWSVFPLTVLAVVFGLFLFHSDVLQTGRLRVIQGLKVVTIAGLPTGCAVFCTLGIVGLLGMQVTLTVIIVGPILLALGVSYGLHITNRYAEEQGTPREKMEIALASTGRAVLLSAVTTIIGFASLISTPLAPIRTIGFILSGGIVIVYVLTMLMVPNLVMLLDLRKPVHDPPRVFNAMVGAPVKRSRMVLCLFLSLIVLSAVWARPNIPRDIDLLRMAPPEETAVAKMGEYSQDFNAGQIGMLLAEGYFKSEDQSGQRPADNLLDVDTLTTRVNGVNDTTAVSITFMMKVVGIDLKVSGQPVWEELNRTPLPDPFGAIIEEIVTQEVNGSSSFWDVLIAVDNQVAENYMLDVFYRSLTNETRELFMSKDYSRTLLYINMPYMPVAKTEQAVAMVNENTTKNYIIDVHELTGIAAVTIAVNNLIVSSQWISLFTAVGLTLMTLAFVFRDMRFALYTTLPVASTVALQWLVMHLFGISLSLVTVMIGSIIIGVGVDYSIHIANRVRELGGDKQAVITSTVTTGMSLTEATVVTILGLSTAYLIPIPEVGPFLTVIIVLLIIAAASALVLLPAIFSFLISIGVPLDTREPAMARQVGLAVPNQEGEKEQATLLGPEKIVDAW